MTLPYMTAHHSLGAPRFSRIRLNARHGYRVVSQPNSSGWTFELHSPSAQKAGKITLKPGDQGRMEIYDLFVHAPHRGKKLSRKLMAEAARKARQLGGTHLWLEASPNQGEGLAKEKLYSIYQSMGFEPKHINEKGRLEMIAPL